MTQPIHLAIERNTRNKCKAISCNNPRHNLSGYCRAHFKRFDLYGDPEGKSIRHSEYKKEFEEVSGIISTNLDHIATQTVLRFIQTWLDKASSGQPCVMASEISRLSNSNVSALDILLETSAVFLFSQRKPNSLPDDVRLSYQIGIAILRLAEQFTYTDRNGKKAYKKASGTDRRAIGKYLRESLGLFLFNVTASINRREQEEQEFREKLWTPLNSTIRTNY